MNDKQQLIEHIANLANKTPCENISHFMCREMAETIATAWIEDREKVVTETLNSAEQRMPSFISHALSDKLPDNAQPSDYFHLALSEARNALHEEIKERVEEL